MAVGTNFFSGISGAAQDIFAGQATASGLRIKAQGTDISAQSTDLSAEATRLQAKGNDVEATNYDEAAQLADLNSKYTAQNGEVQSALADRAIYQGVGAAEASGAGAGLLDSSITDVMADSARQGAIQKQLMTEQNLITEAGYDEQEKSYNNLAEYARYGSSVQNDMAGQLDQIAGSQRGIADQERGLANDAESNSFITAGIKGAFAVASLFT